MGHETITKSVDLPVEERAREPERTAMVTATTEDVSLSDTSPAPRAGGERLSLPDRYEHIRQLGSGGFGEVWRVLDKKLGRAVAMKILYPQADSRDAVRARFIAEAKLTASLQHPGIVAIHDFGELLDGRLWYTMLEVRGRTFRAIVDEAFADGAQTQKRWGRRRLLDVFARTAETVGYAHSRGVIHRDLKPENIMIGEFGQVMVMDWGIARQSALPPDSEQHAGAIAPTVFNDGSLTQQGDILGTPSYMSPEQARGRVDRHGPTSDVYSLGAILFHVLAGHPPFADLGPLAWRRILTSDPPKLSAIAKPDVPSELVAICERAMAAEPGERFADASVLAAAVSAFLDGAHRRERALSELENATTLEPKIASLHARARALREEAKELLSQVTPSDAIEIKLPGWQREDSAEQNEQEAELLETKWFQGILGALTIDPELPEAHVRLADYYKDKLIDAELRGSAGEVARFEVLLKAHDRGKHAAILSGKGALSLRTDPPGALATLYRYSLSQRRLVPELAGELGRTPLSEVSLDKGSYLVRIQSPGRADVAYPVLIERGQLWQACPPGSTEPYPIVLPKLSEIDEDEIYVPAGYAWTGGDTDAPDCLPRRRVWLNGFIAGKYPVTNQEYIAFLNDLVRNGREEEALFACPRSDRGVGGGSGDDLAFERGPDGLFRRKDHDSGFSWWERSPVVLITWRAACLYTRWQSARTGRAVRLLNELEREKATRGVDGRKFPWGNAFDPTWARMLTSQTEAPSPVKVDENALDESPYGMRGAAGNVRDLCANRWTSDGPVVHLGRLAEVSEPEDIEAEYISCRGGSWHSVENFCRAAARFVIHPDQRRTTLGLRVGRSFG